MATKLEQLGLAMSGVGMALQSERSMQFGDWQMNSARQQAYLFYNQTAPQWTPPSIFRCDYCATMFTMEKSCGCGANRCEAATRPRYMVLHKEYNLPEW